jgi:hypothetical protein
VAHFAVAADDMPELLDFLRLSTAGRRQPS